MKIKLWERLRQQEKVPDHKSCAFVKIVTLYRASLKVTLRFIVVLLLSLFGLIAVVLVSLPQEVFSANDVPRISLALVYGEEGGNDTFTELLNAEIENIETVEKVSLCTAREAKTQLASGDVDAVILMSDGMIDTLLYGGHATVTVQANDPLIGTVVYIVADRSIETLDEIQGYALYHAEEARKYFNNSQERYEADRAFSITLIGEALGRLNNVKNASPVSPYYAQILTLLLFLSVSIASLFVAVVAARQYAQGYVRHLHTRGVRFWHLFSSQLLLASSISALLGTVLAIIFNFVGEGFFAPILLIVSSVLTSLVLTPLYLMFSNSRYRPQAATTRVLMCCLALMFFLLFVGGGFYPVEFMQTSFRLFNPVAFANQLSLWALGDPLDPLSAALLIVPAALAGTVSWLLWKRAL
jgi:hypothetical protein